MMLLRHLLVYSVLALEVCYSFNIRNEIEKFNKLVGASVLNEGSVELQEDQGPHVSDSFFQISRDKGEPASYKKAQAKKVTKVNFATFNIQIFGISKMGKPDVVEYLLKILSRYEMIAIQEIRDSSESAFPDLISQLKAYSKKNYIGIAGKRVGRSSSKEQYGFIYRTDRMQVMDEWNYPDLTDDFERPPFVVQFELYEPSKWKGHYIAFANIHTKPESKDDTTINEISSLVNVYDAVVSRYNNPNMVILGDFNADCSYVCKSCWDRVDLWTDPRFTWLVSSNADTTVGNSDCAYDRIVIAGDWIQSAACCAVPFNYEEAYGLDRDFALEISDHYPIEYNFVN